MPNDAEARAWRVVIASHLAALLLLLAACWQLAPGVALAGVALALLAWIAGSSAITWRAAAVAERDQVTLRASTLAGRVRAEVHGRHGPLLAVHLSATEASAWGELLTHAGELAEERAA